MPIPAAPGPITLRPWSSLPNAYFDRWKAGAAYAYSLRSDAELDRLKTNNAGPQKLPVVYDPANDAMLQRARPLEGKCSCEQKVATISTAGTSMLLTFDAKYSASCRFRAKGDLTVHKAYRIDFRTPNGTSGLWLAQKLQYQDATNKGQVTDPGSVAFFYLSSQGTSFIAPGTTRDSSEALHPNAALGYARPDRWTRYWCFVDGVIGGPDAMTVPCSVSIWMADTERDPVLLYDRLPLYTPVNGLEKIRFEFDSSASLANNDEMRLWHRNLLVFQGVTAADLPRYLERPIG